MVELGNHEWGNEMTASTHPQVQRYAKHINPAFVKLLGAFGYGRVFVRAKGNRVWDHEGREYLDFLAAYGAVNLGHNPPRLMEKMRELLLDDVPNLVHVGPQVHAADYAEALTSLTGGLEMCLFSCSGGEAVEAGLKLARAATRRPGFVYCKGGFHGTNLGTLSVMGHERLRAPFEPLLSDCHAVPFGDLGALEKELKTRKMAAFLVEPIQGEGGVIMPPHHYLRDAQELCRRAGTLLVLDEVQTGLGRTGTLFAYQAEEMIPDVLVLGKALGGSMIPISATLTTPEIQQKAFGTMEKFDLHGSTFSGNAFACRTAMATLALLQEEGLVEQSRVKGERLLGALRARLGGHPLVREIRGRGLFVGLELGPTEGGGLQIALCADMAVVSERATFRVPELYRGIADTYYSQMLARLIGPVRARDLMFTGRVLTAQEALDWGMVARVVPHDDLMPAAREVLTACCRTAPRARGVVKASLDAYLGLYDRIGMKASYSGDEARQGFVAFKERRSPDWVHPDLRGDGRL